MRIVDAIADPIAAIEQACEVLTLGEPVAIPTETVYGLAGDIHNGASIRRIYEIKGRPSFNPLICHVSSLEMAEGYVEFNQTATALAKAFWPGPLTLVLKRKAEGAGIKLASASLPTLAVRVPQGFACDLIERFGRGLAAPSANMSGRISPTSASLVADSLADRIKLIIDGGQSRIGVESTVVEVDGGVCRLLRPGGLDISEIEQLIGDRVSASHDTGDYKSPGMLKSHYAPHARVRLNALEVRKDEAVINFGPCPLKGSGAAIASFNLSLSGDLREAAARLFDVMAAADRTGAGTIAVASIPSVGLGVAINDRLLRSAAPRPIN